ncbi:hypothetical protein OIDMADRAFT_20108 [Oidiodendron maius Zn]|uniref:Uncharacterized protein n=1 Tax=Oidiodendron maius (strain Zn) TaxID=913774 RepID=A0A0C3D9A1_OIDMZ|nr:hypothetical protein OIDMADRAFT_20108 [Oidiodendron maius Zn]
MHFSVQQITTLAIALLSMQTIASSVKAEEGGRYKRGYATSSIKVSRIHTRDFEPALYKPAITVRTDEVLDEIDEVLGTGEESVKSFTQKGGKKKTGH